MNFAPVGVQLAGGKGFNPRGAAIKLGNIGVADNGADIAVKIARQDVNAQARHLVAKHRQGREGGRADRKEKKGSWRQQEDQSKRPAVKGRWQPTDK